MYTIDITATFNNKNRRPSILEADISGPEGVRRLYIDPIALRKIARVRSLSHQKKLTTFFNTSLGQNYLEHAYNRD